MVVSSSTPARLPSEPIMFQLSIILLISHRNQKKRAKTWGETPVQWVTAALSGAKSKVLSIWCTLLAQMVELDGFMTILSILVLPK